jgi:hypothetical protein
VATKVEKAPRKRPAAPNGDSRIGRPAMFTPKNLDKHRTTYLTDEGWELVERLREYHAAHIGFTPSDGDVFEDAIRRRAAEVEYETKRRSRPVSKQGV